ncbi:MAG: hypothetical protein PHR83_00715 [Paludibacter sp.]|nr:hypothetical protein [Paludibacter sp.]
MNTFQNSLLNSYKLIVVESKKSPEIVSLIPKFDKGITQLNEITTEIDSLRIQQAKNIKGITQDKNDRLEELGDFIIDVAGAIHSYAVEKGDKTLQAKVDYKINKVHSMKQGELKTAAGIVLEEVAKLPATALTEEGITDEEMTEFEALYNDLKDTTNGNREAVIERSSHTDRIAELFAQAASLKKNTLDRLATQFQRKAPEFYQRYKDASTVIYRRAPKSSNTPEVKA